MPNLLLDLRRPVIAITGIFNPAIFNPGWVAHYLFDMAVGQTVNIAVADGVGTSGIAAFLNGVGISVGQTRTDLFAMSDTDEGLEIVERTALKIIEVLPHSPYGALGINSGFVDDDPPESVLALFSTPEKLEEHFKIEQRDHKVKIAEEDSSRNIERVLSDEGFSVAFNRHCADLNPSNAEQLLIGSLRRETGWNKEFCKSYFGYEEIGVQTFTLPEM